MDDTHDPDWQRKIKNYCVSYGCSKPLEMTHYRYQLHGNYCTMHNALAANIKMRNNVGRHAFTTLIRQTFKSDMLEF